MSKSAGGGDGAESNHKRVQEVSSAIEADLSKMSTKKPASIILPVVKLLIAKMSTN
jgi:hypothetical protein